MGELGAEIEIERARLVRLCARYTGDPDSAEDLAQETLLVAWRNAHKLHGEGSRSRWLAGIARNVCLHWARGRRRERHRLVYPGTSSGEPPMEERLVDDFDLELELERDELADLLDRAMALLPPDVGRALVQHYIHESPRAEVAARLGLSDDALEARLRRGKLTLKRLIVTELSEEAVSFGLVSIGDAGWQETRIWCPDCGERKLVGRFAEGRSLDLDCVSCRGLPRVVQVRGRTGELIWGTPSARLLEGVKGFKAALNRMTARNHEFYKHGIAGRTARCRWCGEEAPLRVSAYEEFGYRDVLTDCLRCGQRGGIGTTGAVALHTPEAQAFWREHGRIRTLPGREVESAGAPATVSTIESVTGGAKLEVVLARDTLRVIDTRGVPGV